MRLCLARYRNPGKPVRCGGIRAHRPEAAGNAHRCPEEIAFRMSFIARGDLVCLTRAMGNSDYARYLLDLGKGEI
jgi:hypothetical protein